MNTVNDREVKSQERRLGWAIFLSILLHFFFIFGISYFKPDVSKPEDRVMTVRLVQDQLSVSQEKSGNKKDASMKKESAPAKKQITPMKKNVPQKSENKKKSDFKPKATNVSKSVNVKKTKTVEKTQKPNVAAKQPDLPKEEIKEKQENVQIKEQVKPAENVPVVTEEVDVFDKFEQSQKETKRQLEEDFFDDSQQSQESLPDFNFDDVLFADNSTPGKDNDGNGVGNEGSKNNNDNESNKGKDIEWSNGGARGLLYSDAIEVPQEVKEAGFKFVIEINFNVDSDGYIRNANIVKSSGNSEWDEDIRRQFCRWIFEKSSKEEKSFGKILISIGY